MKSSTVKRILSAALAISTILAVSGCGESKNPTKNTSSGTGSGGSSTAATYFTPDSVGTNGKDYSNYNPYEGIEKYKGTTVKFATWINHLETESADPIKTFKEKYGINVELVYCAQDNYIESVLALIASGNSPDVYVDMPMWPLTIQIAQPFSVTGMDLNDPVWDQSIIKASSVGDTVYGVNTVNSVWSGGFFTVFNRDLLESNGIKTPYDYIEEGKWTWDALKEIAVQVDKLGNDYYGCAIGEVMAYPSCYGAAVTKYDSAAGKYTNTIKSDGFVKAIQFMSSLNKEGLTTEQNAFTSGKVGWVIRDTYALKRTGYYKAMDPLDIGVADLPSPDGTTSSLAGSWLRTYGIIKGAKNPVAAGMFIRYFLDPTNYDMSKTFVNDEATDCYWKSLKDRYEYSKNNEIVFEALGVANSIGSNVWEWYNKAYKGDPAQVVTNLAEVSNLVDTAVAKSNELINKYR